MIRASFTNLVLPVPVLQQIQIQLLQPPHPHPAQATLPGHSQPSAGPGYCLVSMGHNPAQHAENSSRLRHCAAATDAHSVRLHSTPGSGQRPRLEVDTRLNSKSCSGCDDYVEDGLLCRLHNNDKIHVPFALCTKTLVTMRTHWFELCGHEEKILPWQFKISQQCDCDTVTSHVVLVCQIVIQRVFPSTELMIA